MNLSPYVKCICPACFEEIYLGECGIFSSISGKVLKAPSNGPLARMRVEPLDGPKYVLELAQRKCTNCGYLLPRNIELVPGLTIVVVGDFSSGKSHYLAALIHQIQNQWIGKLGYARFHCLTPKREEYYNQEYFTPLFIQQRMISNTPRATSRTAEPLIYELSLSRSPKHPATTLNLMIYDTSGEDYETMQRLVSFARFVLNTNAFIFVVDPVMIMPFFMSLPPSVRGNPHLQAQLALVKGRRAANLVNSTVSLFESYHKASGGTRLSNIPVAVMISKADLFEQLNSRPNYQFLTDPDYQISINQNDMIVIDREVRELLNIYQQNDLLAATGRFKSAKYFATSATGALPDASGIYQNVNPRRCLDPFLWILSELGIV